MNDPNDRPTNTPAPAGDDAPPPPEFFEPDEPWVSTGDWWLEESGTGLFDEFLEKGASVPAAPEVPEPDPRANPYREILLAPEPDDTPLEKITAELEAIEQESRSGDTDFDPGVPVPGVPPAPSSAAIRGPRPGVSGASLLGPPASGPAAQAPVPEMQPPGAQSGAGRGAITVVAAGIAAAGAVAGAVSARQGKEGEKKAQEAGEAQWYYMDRGNPVGPVPASTIRQWADSGLLPGGTMVWRDGLPSWISAREADFSPALPEPVVLAALRFCDACGSQLRADARFCPLCGKPAAASPSPDNCMACGAQRKPGARFCSNCGQPLGR